MPEPFAAQVRTQREDVATALCRALACVLLGLTGCGDSATGQPNPDTKTGQPIAAGAMSAPPNTDAGVSMGAGVGGAPPTGSPGMDAATPAPTVDAARATTSDAGPVDANKGIPQDAPTDAHVDAATPEPTSWDPRSIEAPPSYMGGVDNGVDCNQAYPTTGFEPDDADDAVHPLFLYFVGTRFSATDASASYDNPAALAVTEAMARRGYVALTVEYDNGALAWLSDHGNQLRCLFSSDSPQSLMTIACAMPRVDCDLGIATWGHSQGAFVGVAAANVEPRVRGAWATGYGGDPSSVLPRERLRVVNGEADFNNGTAAVLNGITGFADADCPADADRCLRANGSGWIRVLRSALADPATSSADHCWFDRRSCLDGTLSLEPNWIDPASTQPYALELNADWLARIAREP